MDSVIMLIKLVTKYLWKEPLPLSRTVAIPVNASQLSRDPVHICEISANVSAIISIRVRNISFF